MNLILPINRFVFSTVSGENRKRVDHFSETDSDERVSETTKINTRLTVRFEMKCQRETSHSSVTQTMARSTDGGRWLTNRFTIGRKAEFSITNANIQHIAFLLNNSLKTRMNQTVLLLCLLRKREYYQKRALDWLNRRDSRRGLDIVQWHHVKL